MAVLFVICTFLIFLAAVAALVFGLYAIAVVDGIVFVILCLLWHRVK